MALVPLDAVLVPLTAALALAVVVERVVEFLKNVTDIAPTSTSPAIVEGELRKAAADLEKLKEFHDGASHDDEVPEEHPSETILVQPATDPDDGTVLRVFVLQGVALAVGIVAAHYTGLRLFSAFGADVSAPTDYLLTGLFIGGGSGPAHVLIRFITQRKFSAEREVTQTAEAPVVAATAAAAEDGASSGAPAVAPALAARVAAVPASDVDAALDIPYAGGVDREKLEHVHKRKANPGLVVFHHTAMPLTSTFDDVVRVIRSRTTPVKQPDGTTKQVPWITGYNCVVTHDGGIHPFCRWDRYGNHAQGYNVGSLGITLNGNFETNPTVPYSNHDGRYGAARPTDAQLDAAARVVALWLFVYPDIRLDFSKRDKGRGINPHNLLATNGKTCPGNGFPYAQFERLVRHYHEQWGRSGPARERIEAFRKRPYLYVDSAIPATSWPVPAAVATYPGGVTTPIGA